MTTFRVLITARILRPDGLETVIDSMHLVHGVMSRAEAEVVARNDAELAGVDVVAVRAMQQGFRRHSD
jgi:predicted RecB family endonuclease